MSGAWDALPAPLDVVYCNFPESLERDDTDPLPGPKPRHALVLDVDDTQSPPYVRVAYGTSKKTRDLRSGEFQIAETDGDCFTESGCTHETKFDLRRSVWLPFNEKWFKIRPGSGQTTPITGRIDVSKHIEIKKRLRAAAQQVSDAKPRRAPSKRV